MQADRGVLADIKQFQQRVRLEDSIAEEVIRESTRAHVEACLERAIECLKRRTRVRDYSDLVKVLQASAPPNSGECYVLTELFIHCSASGGKYHSLAVQHGLTCHLHSHKQIPSPKGRIAMSTAALHPCVSLQQYKMSTRYLVCNRSFQKLPEACQGCLKGAAVCNT